MKGAARLVKLAKVCNEYRNKGHISNPNTGRSYFISAATKFVKC